MKRFEVEDCVVFVGECADIRATYKALRRAAREGRSDILPTFMDAARFNRARIYGLITENGMFEVVSNDTAFRIVFGRAF